MPQHMITNAESFWTEATLLHNDAGFETLALKLFGYQVRHVPVYREFVRLCGVSPESVNSISKIPFLPVEFFKNFKVHDVESDPELCFSSSRTTGSEPSRHYVANPEIYKQSFLEGFRRVYGDPSNYCFLALLPGYLERGDSSLVFMVNGLMQASGHDHNGFYLNDHGMLAEKLVFLNQQNCKVMLLGVSFALLDFLEQNPLHLPGVTVMETGGMKGRGKELIRAELHERIRQACGVKDVHSEYGMTELLSQAYSTSVGVFSCPPWMQVLVRETDDPFGPFKCGVTGFIHIIDLANVHSCAFLCTKDLGKSMTDGRFEVLGRSDASEIRGCNLMV